MTAAAEASAAKVATLQGALADFLASNYEAKLKRQAEAEARAVDAAAAAAAAGRADGVAQAEASAQAAVTAANASADRSAAEVAVLKRELAELRAERDEFIVAREAEMAELGDVANFTPKKPTAAATSPKKRSQPTRRSKPWEQNETKKARSLKLNTDEKKT